MWLYYSNLKRQTTHWFLKFHRVWSWERLPAIKSTQLTSSNISLGESFYEGKLAAFGEDRWLRCILPVVNFLRSEVHLLRIIAWAGKQDVTMATSVGIKAHLCSSQSWAYRAAAQDLCCERRVHYVHQKHSRPDSINIHLRKDSLWHLFNSSPESPLCITSIRLQWQRLKQRCEV